MEHNTRHRIIWTVLRPLAMLIVLLRFGYRGNRYAPKGPYIAVSNHVTDWDPVLMGCSFRTQMYFVASEHILRLGFISKLLAWLVAPIGRQKGGSAAGAVKGILRTIKAGCNVAFFPEGNRTWDGRTAAFPPSTGKLIRTAGCSLVTFRFEGGYFASPRWSGDTARRGKLTGKIVRIYSPEELRAMSVAEINRHITEDLAEDAYARQAAEHTPFRGKKPAEHLESLLFWCPECGAFHSLHSEDSTLCCTACGAAAEYTPTGFLEGSFRYTTVADWSDAQSERLRTLCAQADTAPIFQNEDIGYFSVASGKSRTALATGTLFLYRDRLLLPGGTELPLPQISGMSMRGAGDLYVGLSDGSSFLLKGSPTANMLKYLSACILLGCPVEYGV